MINIKTAFLWLESLIFFKMIVKASVNASANAKTSLKIPKISILPG